MRQSASGVNAAEARLAAHECIEPRAQTPASPAQAPKRAQTPLAEPPRQNRPAGQQKAPKRHPPPEPEASTAPDFVFDLERVVQLAPCMVDGGTTLTITASRHEWHPAMLVAVALARRPLEREEEREQRRRGGRYVEVPVPGFALDLPDLGQLELGADLATVGDMERDVRAAEVDPERWGGRDIWLCDQPSRVFAEATVHGTRRDVVVLHVDGLFWMRLNVSSGKAVVQLKARELWASGARGAAHRVLDLLSWALLRRRCDLKSARAAGWAVSHLELCSDFHGIPFVHADSQRFVGPRRQATVHAIGDPHYLETLNLGSRKGSTSLCIYSKRHQIEAAKGGDATCYEPIWRQHPDYAEDREVRRVEFRIGRHALRLRGEDGESVDFRDPARLGDPASLRVLWSYLADKWRMVDATHTRRHRCAVDPRWLAVQDAAQIPAVELRQARVVQVATHEQDIDRASLDAVRALARVAALLDLAGVTLHPSGAREVRPLRAATLPVVTRFALARATDEIRLSDFCAAYQERKLGFLADEIRTRGPVIWRAYVDAESSQGGHVEALRRIDREQLRVARQGGA